MERKLLSLHLGTDRDAKMNNLHIFGMQAGWCAGKLNLPMDIPGVLC